MPTALAAIRIWLRLAVDQSNKRKPTLRYTKYAALIILALTIVVAVIHQQRESIARKLANAALSEQGITATELSIDTLGTDRLVLSYLLLEQDDGTRYEIFGLSFPFSFPSIRPESISIERVIMTPARVEAAPAPLARMLDGFLQLPDTVPNTEITLSSFTMPGALAVENIRWRSVDQRQHLVFNVQSVELELDVDRMNDGHYEITINAMVDDRPGAFSSTLSLHRRDSGFSIDGTSTVELSPWLSVLQSTGLVSGDIAAITGRVDGTLSIDLSDDESRSAAGSVRLSLADTLSSDYRVNDDSSIQIRTSSSESLQVNIEYPSLQWTAAIEQIAMLTTIGPGVDISVQLSDLECKSGVQCTVYASLDSGPLVLGSVTVASAKLSASLVIDNDDTTRVAISPEFRLILTGVETQDFSVGSITATLLSPLQLTINDNGWRGDVDRIELMVDSLANRETVIASLPLTFDSLHVRDSGGRIDTQISIIPQSATLSWRDSDILMPGIDATISLQENDVKASLLLFDGEGSLSAQVDIAHNMATGAGAISIDDAKLIFDHNGLSRHFLEWPYEWDIMSGTLSAGLRLNWRTGDDGAEYDGTMQYQAESLAGNYDDIVFSGLNTKLSGSVDSVNGYSLSPTSIFVALLDVGVPVQHVSADFSVNVADQSIQVDAVSMSVLGGQIVADPFNFRLQQEKNDIMLRPQSIQLQFMVDLAEFEDIEMSGSISGVIPLTVSENKLTISNGHLQSDPPGGVIRYLPGLSGEDMGVPSTDLSLVSRALGNFQFDSLTSDVNYTEDGDLTLQMRLTGINPDMDDRQPVILNLSVENNIPQLLRSLQATRTIEDILERRSAN